MPILSALSAASAKVFGLLSALVIKVQDTFNRADNASSLGNATTGQAWANTRGTWGISGNVATSSDAGSAYPLASISVGKTDNTVSANITNGGPGVAFWVTDANSWWASSVDYNSTSVTTSTQYNFCDYSQYGSYTNPCACGTPGSYLVTHGYYRATITTTEYFCYAPYVYISGSCYFYDDNNMQYYPAPGADVQSTTTTTTQCDYNQISFSEQFCGTGGYYVNYCSGFPNSGTTTTTTTTYYTTLKLYSSVSGTVGVQSSLQLATSNSSYQTADKIAATTLNNVITVRGYSGASQLGAPLVYTAVNPTKGTRVGVIKTPATANAGSSVDNFESISN